MAATPGDHLDLAAAPPVTPYVFLDGPPAASHGYSPEYLVLPYISRILMEDDLDDKFFYQYPDHPALVRAQQPFLDILASSDDTTSKNNNSNSTLSPSSSSDAVATWTFNAHPDMLSSTFLNGAEAVEGEPILSSCGGGSSHTSSSAFLKGADEANKFLMDDETSADMLNLAFLKGMEEANRFLPSNDRLLINLEASPEERNKVVVVDVAAVQGGSCRGRKNPYGIEELEAEAGRSSKQTAVQAEDVGARQMFDQIVLAERHCITGSQELRIAVQAEVLDLRTLLIHCAQAVATDDRRSAGELLRQIRQHASPKGDAAQRLAHCFADGLQARLAGTGSQVYRALVEKRTSVVDYLKAYMLYMAACCCLRVALMFSNQTIYNAVAGRRKLHIVDYGVHYGFQWPCLLRRLADREGGPLEVRITGIDPPQPGFRPAEHIEETGRRLSDYAREFGVPFKFHAIAAKWETVRVEDLNIDPDEVLVVNSLAHFRNLMDESVVADSPRDAVLNNIREMRPDVFVHAIVNGSYSAPFFMTRFREALFHFSAIFDMLEATAPRDDDHRCLIERDILGRRALNAIACEGAERVERPETYKQWQARNHRAGLRQLPLNVETVQVIKEKVKECYHKDFVIDEDHRWLLQGWRGRILYAYSTWVADDACSRFKLP